LAEDTLERNSSRRVPGRTNRSAIPLVQKKFPEVLKRAD